MNTNTFSMIDGIISVNGTPVRCVTGFKLETIENNPSLSAVTLTFDVPTRDITIEEKTETLPCIEEQRIDGTLHFDADFSEVEKKLDQLSDRINKVLSSLSDKKADAEDIEIPVILDGKEITRYALHSKTGFKDI